MADAANSIEDRAKRVATQWSLSLVRPLGYGLDGTVWHTSRQSALKVFERQDTFERERDCYQRLLEDKVSQLAGFQVPALLNFSDSEWAI